jgi:subtilase family serine protease
VASGTYYLLFQTDISNSILESDENNNVMAVPFTFNSTPPDLVPVSLRVAWVLTGPPNLEVTLVWGVTNQGIGPAVREWGWSDRVSVHQRGVGWDGEFC